MERHNFKKKFGQNFLKSSKFVNKLIDPLDITLDDNILEIGPGDGFVTKTLLDKGAKVFSVEIDYDLIVKLIKRFEHYPNFKLFNEDILNFNLDILANEHRISTIKIIGALPYNISKQIIYKFLKYSFDVNARVKIQNMAFIVQDEVAKDYVAKAPKASFLSITSQIYADVKKFVSIPASNFVPRPKVDGGILVFELKDKLPENYAELERIIKVGYSSPRKKLVSNLASVYNKEKVKTAFEELNLNPNARPAELSYEDWGKLISHVHA